MPIAPVFPGAGAGGGTITALPDWESIDVTDGTWTASDPGGNGRVSSVSVSSGTTTVTWNGFTAGSTDAFAGSSTYEGLRYYQELKYADGTSVQVSDSGWTVETWVNTPAVAGCARAQYALGISSNPTATAASSINLAAMYWSPDRTDGVPLLGSVRTNASALTEFNSANQYCYGRFGHIKGKVGQAFGWPIRSDGSGGGFKQRSTTAYTGTIFLQLNIGVPNSRTISAGETNVWAAYYRVIRTPIGPAGDRP